MLQPFAKIKAFKYSPINSYSVPHFENSGTRSQLPFFLGLRPQAFRTEFENILRLFSVRFYGGRWRSGLWLGQSRTLSPCHCLDGRWRSAHFEVLIALWQVFLRYFIGCFVQPSSWSPCPSCWKKTTRTAWSCRHRAELHGCCWTCDGETSQRRW